MSDLLAFLDTRVQTIPVPWMKFLWISCIYEGMDLKKNY